MRFCDARAGAGTDGSIKGMAQSRSGGLPAGTSVMKNFQRGLKRRGVTWAQTVEATSIEPVTCYVANGERHGVNLAIPGAIRHREVRALALEGFEPMTMGLLWRGEPSELVRAAIAEIQRYSRDTWPEWALADELPYRFPGAGAGAAPHLD